MRGRDLEPILDSSKEKVGHWNRDRLFSSKRQDWATPGPLFEQLDEEFGFTLDAAASAENAKCETFLSEEQDSLATSWTEHTDGPVWLNPPYGRGIGRWIEKAYKESEEGLTVVCLVFCRTDTRWWHNWAMKAAEVRLVVGRVTFEGAPAPAPAPSCVLVFRPRRPLPVFSVLKQRRG